MASLASLMRTSTKRRCDCCAVIRVVSNFLGSIHKLLRGVGVGWGWLQSCDTNLKRCKNALSLGDLIDLGWNFDLNCDQIDIYQHFQSDFAIEI